MEKIVIEFVPELKDYSNAIRLFHTRRRSYWIGLGVVIALIIIVFLLFILGLFTGDFKTILYLTPLLLFLVFIVSIPLWSGWLTIRSASKKENLTLPAKYELNDEKVYVVSQTAEVKYDWSLFDKAFEDQRYICMTYSTNKNMFQFIPKRAFTSVDQENMVRDLIVRHLGGIEDSRKGLTGWKLAGLSAVLMFVFLICLIGAIVVVSKMF